MKKTHYHGQSKEELLSALEKERGVVLSYKSAVAKKGTLTEYRASRKNIARIKTELATVDKK